MIDKCSCKGHPDIPCRLIITLFRVLTPARWWSRLKFCTGHIHLCTCCGCISNQLKAQITGISSHVTNGVAIECHLAIVDVNRIITQCCMQSKIQANIAKMHLCTGVSWSGNDPSNGKPQSSFIFNTKYKILHKQLKIPGSFLV